MAELTPELEAALAPIATNTAQLIAVAKELRRRAEANRNFNFQQFATQLANQVAIADQRQAMIRAYLQTADADDQLVTPFGALLSLSETVRGSLVGMQRIVAEVQASLGQPAPEEPPP